ncbi:Acyl-protein thioesterase [Lachnellula suecica]|uniref:Acyl-protein thioesterase n=1 Tax=Lachnellula suecica TaxID=602035 RepID=A0A8T9C0R0_9HELO|nr:Acyl-protein thioesterase [Lachnellula suecica]
MSSHVHSGLSSTKATMSSPETGSPKLPPGVFPRPLVLYPAFEHRQTFIILHGRGSTAAKFGPPLLETITTSGETLQSAFPHAKIVFLTASRNRATIYKKSYTHQWFDHWHMEEPTKRQDLMRDGLNKSCNYVHSILKQEIESVGKKNVILWGLSQGCATSLASLLTWDGEPFAAMVGMCGYLPFANHIEDIARGNSFEADDDEDPFGREEDDPFSHSDDEDDDIFGGNSSAKDLPAEAVAFLRDEIDMEDKAGMKFQEIPVFLGHGTEDDKVPIDIGREARTCLDLLGAEVQMVEYQGLGHWYSGEMLGDIFNFLREKLL